MIYTLSEDPRPTVWSRWGFDSASEVTPEPQVPVSRRRRLQRSDRAAEVPPGAQHRRNVAVYTNERLRASWSIDHPRERPKIRVGDFRYFKSHGRVADRFRTSRDLSYVVN